MSFLISIGTWGVFQGKFLARTNHKYINKYGAIVNYSDQLDGGHKVCFNAKRDIVRTIKKYYPTAIYTFKR